MKKSLTDSQQQALYEASVELHSRQKNLEATITDVQHRTISSQEPTNTVGKLRYPGASKNKLPEDSIYILFKSRKAVARRLRNASRTRKNK